LSNSSTVSSNRVRGPETLMEATHSPRASKIGAATAAMSSRRFAPAGREPGAADLGETPAQTRRPRDGAGGQAPEPLAIRSARWASSAFPLAVA
jgi:hypothetical protein